MSNRKFASITGSLLARKGEAGPSAAPVNLLPESRRPPDFEPMSGAGPAPRELRDIPVPSGAIARSGAAAHKIAMRLSEAQHLRLRVAAAQLQVTRQALLAAALDHYLTTVCAAGLPGCSCLRSGGGCGHAG